MTYMAARKPNTRGNGNGSKPRASNGNGKKPARRHGNNKLTPEIIKAICEGVRLGMPMCEAAKACGIGQSTITRWKSLGEIDPENEHGRFLAAITRARAEGERRLLEIIYRAAEMIDARHAAWILEHAYSERYGRRQIELSGEVKQTGASNIVQLILANPEAIALAQQLSELVAGDARDNGKASGAGTMAMG